MVKSIQLRVDDDVFKKLKKLKGRKSWEQFLVDPHMKEVREADPLKQGLKKQGLK